MTPAICNFNVLLKLFTSNAFEKLKGFFDIRIEFLQFHLESTRSLKEIQQCLAEHCQIDGGYFNLFLIPFGLI
jgi:hypothetical protein